MLFQTLVKTEEIEIEGQAYTVRYFEATTARGTQRYSSELVLGPGDHIIVDGSSLGALTWCVARLAPATLFSRALAARAAAA
ncbi:MAG: hypothetical protein EXQ55_07060 [Acidobacteria bacterium]|nr:hypothetical protein [Acidobacteriota bacterium]